jgi:hypothetical protein
VVENVPEGEIDTACAAAVAADCVEVDDAIAAAVAAADCVELEEAVSARVLDEEEVAVVPV